MREKRRQDAFVRGPSVRHVAVPSQGARVREGARRLRLHFLDAGADEPHARAAALAAFHRQALLPVALMADEPVVLTVKRHRDVAAAAGRHETAIAALHMARQPAPVQEEDRLFARRQRPLDARLQLGAEHAAVARLQLFAQVDNAHLRHRRRRLRADGAVGARDRADALRQREQRVLASPCALVRRDVRRRAA